MFLKFRLNCIRLPFLSPKLLVDIATLHLYILKNVGPLLLLIKFLKIIVIIKELVHFFFVVTGE